MSAPTTRQIPTRVEESVRGSQVDVVVSGRLSAVRTTVASYQERYPHAGYGTFFDPPKLLGDGVWIVRGTRFASCE